MWSIRHLGIWQNAQAALLFFGQGNLQGNQKVEIKSDSLAFRVSKFAQKCIKVLFFDASSKNIWVKKSCPTTPLNHTRQTVYKVKSSNLLMDIEGFPMDGHLGKRDQMTLHYSMDQLYATHGRAYPLNVMDDFSGFSTAWNGYETTNRARWQDRTIHAFIIVALSWHGLVESCWWKNVQFGCGPPQ